MADEERQDQPEGQEPEGQQPEGQEPEGQQPEGQEPEGQQPDAAPPEASEPEAGGDAAPEAETPAEDLPAGGDESPGEDTGNGEEPGGGDASAEAAPAEAGDGPSEGGPAQQPPASRGGRQEGQDDVIPGAHLEPDLVLEEERQAGEEGEYADTYAETDGDDEPAAEGEEGDQPVAREPLDLAADARYAATGKRKTAVARVILKPGDGVYTINGRHLDQFFPRVRLQRMAQQPLETAGYNGRMDVVARIRGGGVAAQAGALRHGIARALVEADPNLRVELKRRGFLTRDPREKERKKAGLKKARKRPQFSKR